MKSVSEAIEELHTERKRLEQVLDDATFRLRKYEGLYHAAQADVDVASQRIDEIDELIDHTEKAVNP